MAADEVSLEFRICNWLGPLPPSSQDRTLGLGHLAGRTSPSPPAPDRPNTKYTNIQIHKYTGVRSPGWTSSPPPAKYTNTKNTQIQKYSGVRSPGWPDFSSSSGTRRTKYQIHTLKYYTPHLGIFFDQIIKVDILWLFKNKMQRKLSPSNHSLLDNLYEFQNNKRAILKRNSHSF